MAVNEGFDFDIAIGLAKRLGMDGAQPEDVRAKLIELIKAKATDPAYKELFDYELEQHNIGRLSTEFDPIQYQMYLQKYEDTSIAPTKGMLDIIAKLLNIRIVVNDVDGKLIRSADYGTNDSTVTLQYDGKEFKKRADFLDQIGSAAKSKAKPTEPPPLATTIIVSPPPTPSASPLPFTSPQVANMIKQVSDRGMPISKTSSSDDDWNDEPSSPQPSSVLTTTAPKKTEAASPPPPPSAPVESIVISKSAAEPETIESLLKQAEEDLKQLGAEIGENSFEKAQAKYDAAALQLRTANNIAFSDEKRIAAAKSVIELVAKGQVLIKQDIIEARRGRLHVEDDDEPEEHTYDFDGEPIQKSLAITISGKAETARIEIIKLEQAVSEFSSVEGRKARDNAQEALAFANAKRDLKAIKEAIEDKDPATAQLKTEKMFATLEETLKKYKGFSDVKDSPAIVAAETALQAARDIVFSEDYIDPSKIIKALYDAQEAIKLVAAEAAIDIVKNGVAAIDVERKEAREARERSDSPASVITAMLQRQQSGDIQQPKVGTLNIPNGFAAKFAAIRDPNVASAAPVENLEPTPSTPAVSAIANSAVTLDTLKTNAKAAVDSLATDLSHETVSKAIKAISDVLLNVQQSSYAKADLEVQGIIQEIIDLNKPESVKSGEKLNDLARRIEGINVEGDEGKKAVVSDSLNFSLLLILQVEDKKALLPPEPPRVLQRFFEKANEAALDNKAREQEEVEAIKAQRAAEQAKAPVTDFVARQEELGALLAKREVKEPPAAAKPEKGTPVVIPAGLEGKLGALFTKPQGNASTTSPSESQPAVDAFATEKLELERLQKSAAIEQAVKIANETSTKLRAISIANQESDDPKIIPTQDVMAFKEAVLDLLLKIEDHPDANAEVKTFITNLRSIVNGDAPFKDLPTAQFADFTFYGALITAKNNAEYLMEVIGANEIKLDPAPVQETERISIVAPVVQGSPKENAAKGDAIALLNERTKGFSLTNATPLNRIEDLISASKAKANVFVEHPNVDIKEVAKRIVNVLSTREFDKLGADLGRILDKADREFSGEDKQIVYVLAGLFNDIVTAMQALGEYRKNAIGDITAALDQVVNEIPPGADAFVDRLSQNGRKEDGLMRARNDIVKLRGAIDDYKITGNIFPFEAHDLSMLAIAEQVLAISGKTLEEATKKIDEAFLAQFEGKREEPLPQEQQAETESMLDTELKAKIKSASDVLDVVIHLDTKAAPVTDVNSAMQQSKTAAAGLSAELSNYIAFNDVSAQYSSGVNELIKAIAAFNAMSGESVDLKDAAAKSLTRSLDELKGMEQSLSSIDKLVYEALSQLVMLTQVVHEMQKDLPIIAIPVEPMRPDSLFAQDVPRSTVSDFPDDLRTSSRSQPAPIQRRNANVDIEALMGLDPEGSKVRLTTSSESRETSVDLQRVLDEQNKAAAQYAPYLEIHGTDRPLSDSANEGFPGVVEADPNQPSLAEGSVVKVPVTPTASTVDDGSSRESFVPVADDQRPNVVSGSILDIGRVAPQPQAARPVSTMEEEIEGLVMMINDARLELGLPEIVNEHMSDTVAKLLSKEALEELALLANSSKSSLESLTEEQRSIPGLIERLAAEVKQKSLLYTNTLVLYKERGNGSNDPLIARATEAFEDLNRVLAAEIEESRKRLLAAIPNETEEARRHLSEQRASAIQPPAGFDSVRLDQPIVTTERASAEMQPPAPPPGFYDEGERDSVRSSTPPLAVVESEENIEDEATGNPLRGSAPPPLPPRRTSAPPVPSREGLEISGGRVVRNAESVDDVDRVRLVVEGEGEDGPQLPPRLSRVSDDSPRSSLESTRRASTPVFAGGLVGRIEIPRTVDFIADLYSKCRTGPYTFLGQRENGDLDFAYVARNAAPETVLLVRPSGVPLENGKASYDCLINPIPDKEVQGLKLLLSSMQNYPTGTEVTFDNISTPERARNFWAVYATAFFDPANNVINSNIKVDFANDGSKEQALDVLLVMINNLNSMPNDAKQKIIAVARHFNVQIPPEVLTRTPPRGGFLGGLFTSRAPALTINTEPDALSPCRNTFARTEPSPDDHRHSGPGPRRGSIDV